MDCNTLLVKHCFCSCGCDHNANGNGGMSDETIADLQKELTELKEKIEGMTDCSCGDVSGGGNVGEIFWWPTITPPSDSLYCDGSSVSREKYKGLFEVIGTGFGSEDNESFNLPDLRGEFIRGYDKEIERDPEGNTRGIGKHQDATKLPYLYAFCKPDGTKHIRLPFPIANSTGIGSDGVDQVFSCNSEDTKSKFITGTVSDSSILDTHIATRPTNVNLLPCIRYKGTAESN